MVVNYMPFDQAREHHACLLQLIFRVADKQGVYQNFYFDQKYAEQLMACSSEKAMTKCAGNHYYKFLENQFSLHFIRYKNGVEGIRNDQNFRTPVQINRIPAPVPNYETLEDDGSWHYFKLNEITEEQKQIVLACQICFVQLFSCRNW